MRDGGGAERVIRGLNQGVFQGVNVVRWVGDDLEHRIVPSNRAPSRLLSNRGRQLYVG
ncbi:hypothetical protein EDP1_3236 [Pseudomonas putida S610]|nr:hypothetical protein EDP1_3236 [Pseudomonas putida S610]